MADLLLQEKNEIQQTENELLSNQTPVKYKKVTKDLAYEILQDLCQELEYLFQELQDGTITETVFCEKITRKLIHELLEPYNFTVTNENRDYPQKKSLLVPKMLFVPKTLFIPQTTVISKNSVGSVPQTEVGSTNQGLLKGINLVINGKGKEKERNGIGTGTERNKKLIQRPNISGAHLILVENWFTANLQCCETGLVGEFLTDLYRDYSHFIKEKNQKKLSSMSFRLALMYIAHKRLNYDFVTIETGRPPLVTNIELKASRLASE